MATSETTITQATWWAVGIGVVLGGIGADIEVYQLIRAANGLIAIAFLVMLVRAARANKGVGLIVACIVPCATFGYFAFDIWPTIAFWEVVSAILDV